MHDHEKSDLAIVAAKPTNKAGRPVAEPVEPRARTKGNARQHRTRRAQDRESVTQARERVRHVARTRKKERFTTLFHHLSPKILRTAFFALKRDAAPGVDGMTWQDYEARPGPSGSVPAAALPAAVHPEAGWASTPARGRGAGRQDCPARDGCGAERDLRGRLPRVLVRVPAGARPARCAGRFGGRHRAQEGEPHIGRRHPRLLRRSLPEMAEGGHPGGWRGDDE